MQSHQSLEKLELRKMIEDHRAFKLRKENELGLIRNDDQKWVKSSIVEFFGELKFEIQKLQESLKQSLDKDKLRSEEKRLLIEHESDVESWLKDGDLSLKERIIALLPQFTPESLHPNVREYPRTICKQSFVNAYYIFKHPSLLSQLTSEDIIKVLALFGTSGFAQSAGLELSNLICEELIERMNQNRLDECHPDIAAAIKIFHTTNQFCYLRLVVAANENSCIKATAFKQIYAKLRDAQTSLYKTDYLAGKEKMETEVLLQNVAAYSNLNPTSRTAKAWQLTKKYGTRHVTQYAELSENRELNEEINRWAREAERGQYFFSVWSAPKPAAGRAASPPPAETGGMLSKMGKILWT